MIKNKKKVLFLVTPLLTISSVGLSAAQCNPFSKNPIKLDSSQIQQIKDSFAFGLKPAGKTYFEQEFEKLTPDKKLRYGHPFAMIDEYLKIKAKEYDNNAIELKNDKDVKKYFNLDFINVNNLAWGHTLTLKFDFNPITKLPFIHWEVSCSAYGVEGSGDVIMEEL